MKYQFLAPICRFLAVNCLSLCYCLCLCLFVAQVISPHHSDYMSQGKSLGVLYGDVFQKCVEVNDKVTYRADPVWVDNKE